MVSHSGTRQQRTYRVNDLVYPGVKARWGKPVIAGRSVQHGPCSQPRSRELKEVSTDEAVEYRLGETQTGRRCVLRHWGSSRAAYLTEQPPYSAQVPPTLL
jgi:hypothetical protein